MAYTPPTAVTLGALYTQTQHNTDVVDNIIALYAGASGAVHSVVTYNDANFTGDGVDANWVVSPSTDQSTFIYVVRGDEVRVKLTIQASTVANTPAELRVTVPGGLPAAVACGGTFYYNDNGTTGAGRWFVNAGDAVIRFSKFTGTWSNSTSNTVVQADLSFKV